MCEIWTWGQIGFHKKPCGFYNVAGYFNHLLEFIDHMVVNGFMKPEFREMLQIDNDPDKLIEKFKTYSPPIPKWEENTS
jgi:predicted Rossmann-fold nucleotide-binding protein